MKYLTMQSIDGRFTVETRARSLLLAIRAGNNVVEKTDFGDAEGINWNVVNIEDEQGNIVYMAERSSEGMDKEFPSPKILFVRYKISTRFPRWIEFLHGKQPRAA